MKSIFMVDSLGEVFTVQSQKAKDGVLYKRTLVLVEVGVKYGDKVVATLLGQDAQEPLFGEGDFILATVRLSTHEYNGHTYMDAVVEDYLTLGENKPKY